MTTTADAEFWNGIAEKYAKKPVDDVPAFERKKRITKERLRPEQTLFEIGCGTGTLALELAPHVAHVHAMDASSEMIRIANAKKSAQGITNVTFHEGILDRAAPFEPAPFAGVLAYSLLHLVEDRRGLLETLHAMLEPGGFFISSTVCLGSTWVPWRPVLTAMRWIGKAPRVHVLDHEELVREIRDAGFVDVKVVDVGGGAMNAFVVAEKAR